MSLVWYFNTGWASSLNIYENFVFSLNFFFFIILQKRRMTLLTKTAGKSRRTLCVYMIRWQTAQAQVKFFSLVNALIYRKNKKTLTCGNKMSGFWAVIPSTVLFCTWCIMWNIFWNRRSLFIAKSSALIIQLLATSV